MSDDDDYDRVRETGVDKDDDSDYPWIDNGFDPPPPPDINDFHEK